MAEPVQLFPDEDPHTGRFQEDLESAIKAHMERGNMTQAAMVGVLVMVALDLWACFREDGEL